MAWSTAIIKKNIFGTKRVIYGSWTSTGATTGGDIATGLKRVESCAIWHKGIAVEAAVAVVNETFPLKGGDVTIVCTAADTGYWLAIGI